MGKHAYDDESITDFTRTWPYAAIVSDAHPDFDRHTGYTWDGTKRRAAPAHADPDTYTPRLYPGKHAIQLSYHDVADVTYAEWSGDDGETYRPDVHDGYTWNGVPRHGGKRHAAPDRY